MALYKEGDLINSLSEDDPWNQPDAIRQRRLQSGQQTNTQTPSADNPDAWGGGQPQEQPDTSGWNTEGYGTPQLTATDFGDNPMLGWEAGNWNDPNMQTPKYVGGRLWSDNTATDPASVEAAAQEFIQAYPGSQYLGRDKIQLPNGEIIDFVVDYGAPTARFNWESDFGSGDFAAGGSGGGSQAPLGGQSLTSTHGAPLTTDPFAAIGGGVQLPNGDWVPKDHPLAKQHLAQQGQQTNTGGGGSTPVEDDNAPNTPPGVNTELWEMLMERAQQGLDVDRSDPAVRAQADAFSAQQERARRNYLNDMAESSSPYATGAMGGAERMTASQMGQSVGAFEAELVGREIQSRRDEIEHALTEMGDLLTEQQRQALQLQLAEMDDELQRLRLEQDNSQFYAGLSQADKHMMAQLAQRDRLANMDNDYRYAALGQDDRQFLDRLGFDINDRGSYWDALRRGQLN